MRARAIWSFARRAASSIPRPCPSPTARALANAHPVPWAVPRTRGSEISVVAWAVTRTSTLASPAPCPPVMIADCAPASSSTFPARAALSSSTTLMPVSAAASGQLGVQANASGRSFSRSASRPAWSSSSRPLVDSRTGSTISGARWCQPLSFKKSATVETVAALPSMPVLMASGEKSSASARS